jgi:light-regulated signal transduction histidine kinase (bacteriophytochrome)
MLARETQGRLSAKAQRHLQVIADASEKMSHLVDDLLSFSRMGRTEMHETKVVLERLVHESIQDLEMATRGRNITWNIAPLPAVIGDRSMLKQVFVNLLDNAVKYSLPRNPAEIEIGCVGQQDGWGTFFVRDNGVGFDMKYAHRLFGVFQRLHRADEFEGTGIGLANVRRIVARHGGRVWIEAVVNKGATVFFALRLSPPK